jgi:hypothetical protein
VSFKEREFPFKETGINVDRFAFDDSSDEEDDTNVQEALPQVEQTPVTDKRDSGSNHNIQVEVVIPKVHPKQSVQKALPVQPPRRSLHIDTQKEPPADQISKPAISKSSGTESEYEDPQDIVTVALDVLVLQARNGHHDEHIALMAHSTPDTPTFSQAMQSSERSEWITAMQSEIQQLKQQGTYTLVTLPNNRKAIPSKWVLKIKRDHAGKVIKKKARLTAGGHKQEFGIDYTETYAPVSRLAAIHILLTKCATLGWHIHQIDVVGAYLNGKLEEEVYMRQPAGFEVGNPQSRVWRLHKTLYGLKQAGREWHITLTTFIQEVGFRRCNHEWGIYSAQVNGHSIDIAIYVDDVLVCSSSLDIIQYIKDTFGQEYDITDEGTLKWYLGIHITHTNNGFYLSQTQYIDNILEHLNMSDTQPFSTPGQSMKHLCTPDEQHSEHSEHSEHSVHSVHSVHEVDFPYRETVGALLYLANGTRPDISANTNYVA